MSVGVKPEVAIGKPLIKINFDAVAAVRLVPGRGRDGGSGLKSPCRAGGFEAKRVDSDFAAEAVAGLWVGQRNHLLRR